MARKPEQPHQFTSPYPPKEFISRFLPFAADALATFNYSLKAQSESSLLFEYSYKPLGNMVLGGIGGGLGASSNIKTLSFLVEPYAHGSLITARGHERKVMDVLRTLAVWE